MSLVFLSLSPTVNIKQIIQLHGYTPATIVESFIAPITRDKNRSIKKVNTDQYVFRTFVPR